MNKFLKTMLKYKFSALLSIVICNFALGAGYSPYINIDTVLQSGDGKIYIKQSETTYNPDSCTYTNTYVMYSGHSGINRSLAMIMFAKQNNKKVRFYLNDCNGTVPVFSAVEMQM